MRSWIAPRMSAGMPASIFIVHPEACAGVSGLDNTVARSNYLGNVKGSYLRM
jgi:hypothetical protein